jgi:hypothetical protein
MLPRQSVCCSHGWPAFAPRDEPLSAHADAANATTKTQAKKNVGGEVRGTPIRPN